MEGDCKMEAQPMKNYTVKNKYACREICETELECMYYIFHRNWTCTLYPDAKKVCKSFIGAASVLQCKLGIFFQKFIN